MMATNVSFSADDQTDEDFFDKLVDDDFGGGGQEGGKSQEGDDLDEIKAFGFDDSPGIEAKEQVDDGAEARAVSSNVQTEESTIGAGNLPSSAGSVIEHNNVATDSWSAVDPAISKTAEAGSAGVKVIQWNSLFTDSSAENEGFGSYADLFGDVGIGSGDLSSEVHENQISEANEIYDSDPHVGGGSTNDASYVAYGETQANGPAVNSIEYWESQYPGWKYDTSTGQWYQVDNFVASANDQQADFAGHSVDQSAVSEATSEVSYLQQATLSVANSVVESGMTESVSSWNQRFQEPNGYPEHMVFDPQYPGWYYDTLAQEWRTLESYAQSNPEATHAGDQQNRNGFPSSDMLSQESDKGSYHGYDQVLINGSQTTVPHGQYGSWDGVSSSYDLLDQKGFESNGIVTNNISKNNSVHYGQYAHNEGNNSQAFGSQGQISTWAPVGNQKQDLNIWQPNAAVVNGSIAENRTNQRLDSLRNYHVDRFSGFPNELAHAYDNANISRDDHTLRTFNPSENLSQQFNQAILEPQQQFSNDYYSSQKPSYLPQQLHQSGSQFSYNPSMGRSSAGRPPHALVSFGFGGKLVVTKDSTSYVTLSNANQDPTGGSISVLNLLEVVTERNNANNASSGCDYFQTLCQHSFPGPLVGGSVGNKELNKWIDERISNCESSDLDYRKVKTLQLLLSLLRIACQHYGKLRSPFGSDTSLKANDSPESAVAKLFASAKGGNLAHCLQQLPSEVQLRATASEVQNLLVSGSKREALECALQGQLWGPALVLASQLGDQFYVDAVKQMALRQLVPGSPLRTLCLLIAGQPQAVFSSENDNAYSDAINMYQQATQVGANSMLDYWQENLAVISANRTKDDELVIINLGDCLWRDRSEIIAAHICYLVADTNFEPYSDSARLCLIGANHLKFPRTYASPAAIQITELYEYSKVLGNSQFVLLPFQPYKLVYAHMLAELGKVSDSLKYCQAILKSLKTGRAPEVEYWKQIITSFEERLRTHQQGGFSTNLAPAKLVGKLLNFFDSTTQRVIGGLPPPGPSAPHGSAQSHEHYQQPSGPRVLTSQSTMAMSSLVPSPSTEQVNEWSGQNNKMTFYSRSASEPNFGRSDQVDPSKEIASPNSQSKASASSGSRFGRFGFGSQFIQKTMGLVLKSRSDKQAKLGETNKFYYDEKLKRWVEEGAEPPAEEAALLPPPTAAAFHNGTSDHSNKFRSESPCTNASPDRRSPRSSDKGSGIPPIPPNSSHFSARGRAGVRSRYVDTYNQGSVSPAQMFQSPPIPSVKRAAPANAKFFVPSPSSMGEQTMGNFQETTSENPSTSTSYEMTHSSTPPTSSSMAMQRFPSMVNISHEGNGDGSLPHSRRNASWGGSFNNSFSPPKTSEVKPLGDMLGFSPSTSMPSDASSTHMLPANGGSFGDELQEVEL